MIILSRFKLMSIIKSGKVPRQAVRGRGTSAGAHARFLYILRRAFAYIRMATALSRNCFAIPRRVRHADNAGAKSMVV